MSNQPPRPPATPAVTPDTPADPEEIDDIEVGPEASLEGYFDLDEEEQTERIMEMFGFMSPNEEVRKRAAESQRKRRQK